MEHKCLNCGRVDDPTNYPSSPIEQLMEEKGFCFECAFWLDRKYRDDSETGDIDDYTIKSNIKHIAVIINGCHYTYQYNNPILVVKQANLLSDSNYDLVQPMHYILFFSGELVKTNLLRSQGEIPGRFLPYFRDNAIFLNQCQYLQLANHKDTTLSSAHYPLVPKHLVEKFLKNRNIQK